LAAGRAGWPSGQPAAGGRFIRIWRKDIGLRLPSSSSEFIYSSPEWYDESLASQSLSPATKKRHHDELEKDTDELTTDSDIMSGQEGKSPSELDAIIAYYLQKVKDSRMQAIIRSREETDKYIQMEAAYAFEVSTHITAMFRFPPDILSAGSAGGAPREHPPSY